MHKKEQAVANARKHATNHFVFPHEGIRGSPDAGKGAKLLQTVLGVSSLVAATMSKYGRIVALLPWASQGSFSVHISCEVWSAI